MRRAVDADDHARLQKAAHALRGSAANVGANPVADTAGKLEAMGAAGSLAGAGGLIDRLQVEFSNVLAELRVLGVGIDAGRNEESP